MNLLCCFEDTTVNSMSDANSSGKKEKPQLPEGALEICRKFDKDGNGYLSKSELKEALGNSLSKAEIDNLMKEADTDHDGKVDYNEFFKAAFSK